MEKTVLYNLGLNYKGTSDKISFMKDGIRVPIFLANHVFGRKKNFFQNENIIECSSKSYFLPYGHKFDVMVEKNRKRNTYSLYLKANITPLDDFQRVLLNFWRGKEKYFVLSLEDLEYESLVKIYALLDNIPTIDKISLEDVELIAREKNEARYIIPFFILYISALFFFFVSFPIEDDYSFLLIFNPSYLVLSLLGLVIYNAIKPKTEKVLHRVKIYHIFSWIIFLGVNVPFLIYTFNKFNY